MGIVVGLLIAMSYWAAHLACRGASLTEALRGQVEDALGVLQALLALGGLCGSAIGLCAGLRALSTNEGHSDQP
jgi:hypothetical protein